MRKWKDNYIFRKLKNANLSKLYHKKVKIIVDVMQKFIVKYKYTRSLFLLYQSLGWKK